MGPDGVRDGPGQKGGRGGERVDILSKGKTGIRDEFYPS